MCAQTTNVVYRVFCGRQTMFMVNYMRIRMLVRRVHEDSGAKNKIMVSLVGPMWMTRISRPMLTSTSLHAYFKMTKTFLFKPFLMQSVDMFPFCVSTLAYVLCLSMKGEKVEC